MIVNPRIIRILRWTARIWSGLLAVLVVMISVTPDPNAVKPIPLGEMVELGFYGLALLGLILAWRWEILGGVIVLIGVLGNNIAFGFFRGYWFHGLSIPSLLFGLPAILFLLCWASARQKRSTNG